VHRHAARTLAKHGDLCRIATKAGNVIADPPERSYLVENREISADALISQSRVGEKAKSTQAVVKANKYKPITSKVFS
jgi:hypothetical protein